KAQLEALARSLASNTANPYYLVAALNALEQVGDGTALPMVRSLASGKMKTADPKRVQAAARECLPYLQVRFEQQRATQTLLRASHVSKSPHDRLLRPAQSGPDAEAEGLLRPSEPAAEPL